MKQINREAIQRMVNAQANSYQSGGSGEGSSMAGYATQVWVEGNYLSKEFFNRLFTIHGTDANDDPTTVLPNDMDTTIVSIESMFGFWTEFYLSALGQGSGGSTAITLSMLDDVQLTNPTSGQVLTYNGTKWVNADSSGGIDIGAVWTALAAGTSEQINASHLTTALTNYATQTWIGQNYLPLSGGTLTGQLLINSNKSGCIIMETNTSECSISYKTGTGARCVLGSFDNRFFLWNTTIGEHVSVLHANGNVGIGNNNPSYRLDVNGTFHASGNSSIGGTLGVTGNITMGSKLVATQEWVNTQISGMATQTWVSNNYLGINATAAAASKLATARTLWGQSFNGTANVSGNMSSVGNMTFSSSENIFEHSNGSYTDPAPGSDVNFKFGGSLAATYISARYGVLSNGYVTSLSDIRMKNVKSRFEIDPMKIAGASLIRFEWKDGHDRNVHVGGIAQEWDEILPEAVIRTGDGMLAMDYGTIGMACAVSLARKVVEQDRRIEQLQKRIERLERLL